MNKIKAARIALKIEMYEMWPGLRCACGEYGATDLGHIVYTRHPDSVELYSDLNCCMLHNSCNSTGERLWINVNACLILLKRAGGPEKWEEWARTIPCKGSFHIPHKMVLAMDMWKQGIRPFEIEKIRYALW